MHALRLDLSEHRLDGGRNSLDDALDPLGGRMQAVRSVELRVARDAVEEERIERDAVLWRGQDRSRRIRARSRRRDWARRACRRAASPYARPWPCRGSRRARLSVAAGLEAAQHVVRRRVRRSARRRPPGTPQSKRASPSAAVSPETPALTTSTSQPLARSAACRRSGKAWPGGRPSRRSGCRRAPTSRSVRAGGVPEPSPRAAARTPAAWTAATMPI